VVDIAYKEINEYYCVIKRIQEKHNFQSDVYRDCKNCLGYGFFSYGNEIIKCKYYTPEHLLHRIFEAYRPKTF